jgi:hypothetical protein
MLLCVGLIHREVLSEDTASFSLSTLASVNGGMQVQLNGLIEGLTARTTNENCPPIPPALIPISIAFNSVKRCSELCIGFGVRTQAACLDVIRIVRRASEDRA